jgi:tRNA uridine 5-carboxymethylaminomethyl modification enzyme
MKHLGFELMRLKTGTPPRISKRSVNFDALTPQRGDEDIHYFSLRTCPETLKREQLLCFQVFTNPDTHRLIREHLWEAPLYDGTIKGIGPRYCPSIETKVVNFPEKYRHLLFIEPEGWDHPWVYLNGFSTSLPEEVQIQALHTIAGLEEAEIARPGYAIEYDAFPPHQVKYTLESHLIEGLYLAGQIIGTSGYEEAAALGIMAGINAVLKIQGQPPFILDRSQAYIGVMIDDLIIRGAPEPYRMFTSRAEYRLLLRSDNADERLIGFSQKYGLLDNETVCKVQQKLYAVDELLNRLKITRLDFNGDNYSALELLKRPEIDINALFQIVLQFKNDGQFSAEEKRLVEIRVKYQGYIERQLEEVARYRKMESKFIPGNINYDAITSISYEGRERLKKVRPPSLGAASRLYGVTPADVAVLSVHLNKRMFPVEP